MHIPSTWACWSMQLQTCPIHVTTACNSSFFQLVWRVSLACTMHQLETNLGIHLVKKHHGRKFAFVAVKNRGLFWRFHYKMWGRAPWAGTSLLINQCKDCWNPGRSPSSAWLNPGGFDLEMEKYLNSVGSPSSQVNIKPFLKYIFKCCTANHTHRYTMQFLPQNHTAFEVETAKHRLVFRVVFWD